MLAKRADFGGLEGNSLIIVYYYARRLINREPPHRSAGAVGLISYRATHSLGEGVAFSGGTLRGWATYRRLDALR